MKKINTNVVIVNDQIIAVKIDGKIFLYEKKEEIPADENEDIAQIKEHLRELEYGSL